MWEALTLYFFISPVLALLGWAGTLYFGFSETYQRTLLPLSFFGGTFSALYFIVFGFLWLTHIIDPPTLVVGWK